MPFDTAATNYGSFDSEGNKKTAPICCGCLTFLVACGLFAGSGSSLSASTRDDRGVAIAAYKTNVQRWVTNGSKTFSDLQFSLNSQAMRGERFELTPASLGEKAPLFPAPSPLTDYRYAGYVECPAAINATCNVQLNSVDGKAHIVKNVVAHMQVGPTPHLKASQLCQWYDGDYLHPMASIGMGACNTQMRGAGNIQTYNFGPSRCVLDAYLDSNGCPADMIPTQTLVNYGWTWATHLGSKKRFEYSRSNGKCWDYTDCYCESNGLFFKTDATQGYGFTGYGFYAAGQWHPFAKPASQMTDAEKAAQCRVAFQAKGVTIPPAAPVNLVCFRAGGFPKIPCSQYCREQDTVTATYTPPQTIVTMNTLYGPWGIQGAYPSYTNVPATCAWTTTRSTKLTKLNVVTDDRGQLIVSKYATLENETGTVPFPPAVPGTTVSVAVEVVDANGPRLTAARATDDCNLKSAKPSSPCFGLSPAELAGQGMAMAAGGGVLILLACCCCLLGAKRG